MSKRLSLFGFFVATLLLIYSFQPTPVSAQQGYDYNSYSGFGFGGNVGGFRGGFQLSVPDWRDSPLFYHSYRQPYQYGYPNYYRHQQQWGYQERPYHYAPPRQRYYHRPPPCWRQY